MLWHGDWTWWLGRTSLCLAERWDAELQVCFKTCGQAKGLSERGSEEADLTSCIFLWMLQPFRVTAQQRCGVRSLSLLAEAEARTEEVVGYLQFRTAISVWLDRNPGYFFLEITQTLPLLLTHYLLSLLKATGVSIIYLQLLPVFHILLYFRSQRSSF